MATPVLVVQYPSKSTPKVKHTVKVYRHGNGFRVSCTCLGAHVHKTCWHQNDAKQKAQRAA